MDWSEVTLAEGDDLIDAVHACDFHDIAESSFHGDQSLLENLDTFDFTELPGPSFARDSTVQVGGGRDDFNIRLLKEKALKTMGVKEVSYELTFNDRLFHEQKKMNEVFDLLREAFQKMLDRVKRDLRPGDIVRVAIHNEGLDLPVFVPFRPMENMNADTVLETLTHVLNSNEDGAFDSSCRVDVGAIRYPRGGKGHKMSTLALKIATLALKIAKKRSIVAICNDDNICLVRATLVAHAGACKLHPDEFRKLQMRQPTFTTGEMLIHFGVCPIWYYNDLRANHKRAQDLLTIRVCEALGIVADEPLTYAWIPRLEEFLIINLYVISASMGDKFSYISAHHDQERKKVFLYHEDINDKEHFHAIPNITGFFTSSYFCQHCLVPFQKPYRHHCVNYCGVCQSYDCRKGRELTCSECHRTCRSQACYRRHKKIDKKTKKYLKPPCTNTCGRRERVFETLHDLGIWMFSDTHKGFTVFFHNLSYDGCFLIQYLISQTIRPSFVIYRGSKIQMFNVGQLNIRVLDSFNFLPMALGKLPKAFQLDSLKKGYFPHFFTSVANLTYVGSYPPAETYGPDGMTVEGRKEFYRWYDNQVASGAVFDFRKEMLEYCRSDVDILRRACLKFKNLLWDAKRRWRAGRRCLSVLHNRIAVHGRVQDQIPTGRRQDSGSRRRRRTVAPPATDGRTNNRDVPRMLDSSRTIGSPS